MAALLVGGWSASDARGQEQFWKSFGDHSGGLFGEAVNRAGDVNADGVPDVIVGARLDGGSGMARVLSGLDGSTLVTVHGAGANEQFGFAVAGIGDVDGDGYDDFAVGAPMYGPKFWRGRVSVFTGQTGALLYQVQRGYYDRFGWSLAATDDRNGDTVPDFVVGAAYGHYAEVVSGVDGSTIFTLTQDSGLAVEFGYAVASGGDVNGDGVTDLLVSDPFNRDLGAVGGAVWIFSGVDGSVIRAIYGGGGFFGGAIAMVGDVNGDGRSEVLVGAQDDSTVATSGGAAFLYSGSDAALLYSFAPTSASQALFSIGAAVGGAGDMNRDGFADFVIGVPGYFDAGGGSGAAFLYSGRDGGPLYHFQDCVGTDPKLLGWGVALVGDLNGDHVDDLAVGATVESSPGVLSAGSASTYRGNDLFVDVTPHVVTASDTISMVVGQGVPGNLSALMLVDLNGVPMPIVMALAPLDATGRTTFVGQIPPGLGSLTAGFKAFTTNANHKLIDSGMETLFMH